MPKTKERWIQKLSSLGGSDATLVVLASVVCWNRFLFFILSSLSDDWSQVLPAGDLTIQFADLVLSLPDQAAIAASPFTSTLV